MLYFIIALAASAIGALSGLGGGVIIKPLLDALTGLDSSVISFLSTVTVFSMSLSAAVKYAATGCHLWERTTVILAVGAALGGTAGTGVLNLSIALLGSDSAVKLLQNSVLLGVLVLVAWYMGGEAQYKLQVTSGIVILLTGWTLGATSAFLGIGGGPINVAALTLLFSMDLRQTTVSSMVLILFSQGSKLLSVFMAGGPPSQLDYRILLLMVPAGVVGGLVGSALNRRVGKGTLRVAYQSVLAFVIVTCVYNIFKVIYTNH